MRLDFKNRVQLLRNYFKKLNPCALRDSIMENLDVIDAMPDNEYKDEGIKLIEDYLDNLNI